MDVVPADAEHWVHPPFDAVQALVLTLTLTLTLVLALTLDLAPTLMSNPNPNPNPNPRLQTSLGWTASGAEAPSI